MTVEVAFKILDLPQSSTIEEIEKKYKFLIKNIHPDKQNGNNDKASDLNNAREFAVRHISERSTSLAIIRQVAELIKVDNNAMQKKQEYRSQSDAIFSRATRKSINRYKQMQSTTKLLGAFSAVLALASSNILPIFEKFFGDNPIYSAAFTIMTFAIGIYYLMFNTMTEKIKDSLDDFKETLDDKASYYDIVNSVLLESSDLKQPFSRQEFDRAIQKCLGSSKDDVVPEKPKLDTLIDKDTLLRTARRLGDMDFSKLLIAKGLEKGILKEIEIIENGLPTIVYSFEPLPKANT